MKTILIIEDSEQNLYLARYLLEQHGHRVLAAPDGPCGIRTALERPPSLILLDIQLPGMDGYEVARALRSHRELDGTPIVAVTSYAMPGDRERALGAGCSGYLEKPINPATFVADVAAHFPPATAPASAEFRVLVVDDGENNRELLRALFTARGWQVETAAHGADALSAARTRRPGLVVSDILMPGMDGFSLCREWRRDPDLRGIPFIFFTATYTGAEDERFGLSLGADAFLTKPCEPEPLLERIDAVLAARGVATATEAEPGAAGDERAVLREYNAVLVRKLEDKMLQVEALNRDLEERVRQRTRELEAANLELQAFGQIGTWALTAGESPRLAWSAEGGRIFRGGPEAFEAPLESLLAIVHPEDADLVRGTFAAVATGGAGLNLRYRVVRPDGQIRWVHQESGRAGGATGSGGRICGIIRDVTETRLLEEQLRQAQKMEAVGRLAQGVAHDFNNLLTVIFGHAGMMAAVPDLPTRARELLEEVTAAAGRASKLTRQLLTFGRRQSAHMQAEDLNGIVTDMERLLRSLVGSHGRLELSFGPGLPRVRADAAMLEQVVMNLVVNARDALADDGWIRLETSTVRLDAADAARLGCPGEGTYVVLAVSDSGSGIAPADLPRIFEPFFTTKPEGKGTGLGLAVVYGVVRQHGGHVVVRSDPGAGATFTVFLPAAADAPSAPKSPA